MFFKNLLLFFIFSLFALLTLFYLNFNLISSKKTPLNWTKKSKILYLVMIVISVLILHFPYSNILILSLLTFLPIVAKFLDVYDFVRNKKFIKLAQAACLLGAYF